MDATALLALINEGPDADAHPQPPARQRVNEGRRWRARHDRRESQRINEQLGDLSRKMRKYNSSGLAVTHDDLMLAEFLGSKRGRPRARHLRWRTILRIKVKGSGKWKRWLPEAIRRAASSTGTVRTAATSIGFVDRSHGQVHNSRFTASRVILNA